MNAATSSFKAMMTLREIKSGMVRADGIIQTGFGTSPSGGKRNGYSCSAAFLNGNNARDAHQKIRLA
jgi:hypothetical protein